MNSLNESLELRNRFIQGVFGRYLSDEIVEELLKTPEGLKLGGEKRNLTIMMTDLRGFTSLAERLSAEEVLEILNHYLEKMTDIIFEHQGTLDEILGDGIMIIFGAPVYREDNELRAIRCALDMQLAMESVNQWNREKGYPVLSLGIGINSGEMVVGNIGSMKRTKYGVVGAEVNLAARVESYTVGGQILVSQSTQAACREDLMIRDTLKVLPKGCTEPIYIFDIRGLKSEPHRQLPLDDDESMKLMEKAEQVSFRVLAGKDVGVDLHSGHIMACGQAGIQLKTEYSLKPMENIVLMICDIEIYGKVTSARDREEMLYEVTFTSVSTDVQMALTKLGFT
jgi:class 3 adenylate cyclase